MRRGTSRRPGVGASSFFLSVSLFAAVAWVGKDALFSDISQERAQILQAEPIVASHVSADAASSLADTSVHDQSAVAPTPSENSAPAAAESGGDGDSDGNEGRDYIESISKQMQDKIQAYIGQPTAKLATTAVNISSEAQKVHVLPVLAGKSDGDLDDLANSLLDQQSNKSMSSEVKAKALASMLQNHKIDVTAKTSTDATATKPADQADKALDEKAQLMYEKMKLQKQQEAAVLQKKAATTGAAEAPKPTPAKPEAGGAASATDQSEAAKHDQLMDSEAEKMFAAEQKKEQTLASAAHGEATAPAAGEVKPEAASPADIADVPKPAAIAGKTDGDLDAEAAAMMNHLKQTKEKPPSKASSSSSQLEQLWSAQSDTDANAEAAADDKLVADLDKPDVMPVKASKAGHHTVAFDLSAVVGKKAKNLDELANEMMKNLDEGKGVGAHKHKAHTGGASALPPDIAAAVAKLKGAK